MHKLEEKIEQTIKERNLATEDSAVLLMVSGGSDSTALAYLGAYLREKGAIKDLAMLHVNHKLRPGAAEVDQAFVEQLAQLLEIPLFICEIDVAGEASRLGENVEAVARRERYAAAQQAWESMCFHTESKPEISSIFMAHTQDDRVENFYMRSIVGTGPGGFRSMQYRNGNKARPCLDVSRKDLRNYIKQRAEAGLPVVRDEQGNLWREDASNEETDYFRAYVRKEIIPLAKKRNPQLLDVLCRSMNLIADEDDMLESMTKEAFQKNVSFLCEEQGHEDKAAGCLLQPGFAFLPVPLQRRVIVYALHIILGFEARIESASVQAICEAFEQQKPKSGYVANIQGNLAVSSNKKGVRIEPMAAFRARRKPQHK